MAAKSGAWGGLAKRYAAALYELAEEAKALDAVAGDLRALAGLLHESKDLDRLTRSPLLRRTAKAKAMDAVLERGKAQDLTRRFVATVARNGRLFVLGQIVDAFLSELARRRGEEQAVVISARKLTKAQTDAVAAALRGARGARIALDTRVDPTLLGGLVVRVGSRMIDTSLRSKLARLQLAMKEA